MGERALPSGFDHATPIHGRHDRYLNRLPCLRALERNKIDRYMNEPDRTVNLR